MTDATEPIPIHTSEITYRSLYDYSRNLQLSEEKLRNGINICDIGSGLSDFSESVRAHYGQYGSTAIAMDSIYALFPKIPSGGSDPAAFKQLQELLGDPLARPNIKTYAEDPYNGDPYTNIDYWYADQRLGKRINSIKEDAIANPGSAHFVAGSIANLPFADGQFDLVTSSNVLLHPLHNTRLETSIGKRALSEAIRILKPDGECRMFISGPLAGFDLIEETLRMSPGNPESGVWTAEQAGKLRREKEAFFAEFEKGGVVFYLYKPDLKTESLLIASKDGHMPTDFVNQSAELYRLNFSQVKPDDPTVPFSKITVNNSAQAPVPFEKTSLFNYSPVPPSFEESHE